MWLIAAHGAHADYVVNLIANSRIRLRDRRRWHTGTATIHTLDPKIVDAFNTYARGALRLAIEPRLIRIDYSSASRHEPPAR